MKASAVGKRCSVAERAYCAGLIDGDGAIMAIIEPHNEKKFKFRVRIQLKITQKHERDLVFLVQMLGAGSVRKNRTTSDWLTRDQKQVERILELIAPYSKMKRQQIQHALEIIHTPIQVRDDLMRVARLADSLSKLNVRSKNRRKNYAAMIQEHLSSND
jgi:LAGLIDADG endonuclease